MDRKTEQYILGKNKWVIVFGIISTFLMLFWYNAYFDDTIPRGYEEVCLKYETTSQIKSQTSRGMNRTHCRYNEALFTLEEAEADCLERSKGWGLCLPLEIVFFEDDIVYVQECMPNQWAIRREH